MTVFAHTDRPAAVQPPPLPFQIGTGSVPRFAEIAAPRKWNRLATSFVLHSVAILLLIKIAGLVPAIKIVARNDESATLILPSLDRPIPAKVAPISPKVLAQIHQTPKLPSPTPIVAPRIEMPVPKPEAPKIVVMNNLPPELPKPPAPPKKIVQGVFDSASALYELDQLHLAQILRTLKHHVLEQMSKSSTILRLHSKSNSVIHRNSNGGS